MLTAVEIFCEYPTTQDVHWGMFDSHHLFHSFGVFTSKCWQTHFSGCQRSFEFGDTWIKFVHEKLKNKIEIQLRTKAAEQAFHPQTRHLPSVFCKSILFRRKQNVTSNICPVDSVWQSKLSKQFTWIPWGPSRWKHYCGRKMSSACRWTERLS